MLQDVTQSGGDGFEVGQLSDEQFKTVTTMVKELSGIIIQEHKREMIHARLARRLRALKMTEFSDYLTHLSSPSGKGEVGEFVNAVTTNLTSFFRENHHFEHLRSEMIEPMAASGAKRLRIWSSASSSGEEPYSIAMTLKASAGFDKIQDAKMLATDLDTNMLASCRAGQYTEERIEAIPADMKKKFLQSCAGGKWEFKQELKSLIAFKQLNLLHDWPVKGPFDVIFCRNVLIYFDAETKRGIVDRMVKLLRPEGALYLGHSESLLGDHPMLTSEGRTIYRRKP